VRRRRGSPALLLAGAAARLPFLHEAGKLGRALEGCEAAPSRKLGYMEACAA
jgi:hypothetical protein